MLEISVVVQNLILYCKFPFKLIKSIDYFFHRTYFQKFGNIIHYNFTSPTGGYVFITYENPSMVNKCMTCRPHSLDGQHL